MKIKSLSDYQNAYAKCQNSQAEYWGDVAENFSWHKKWDKVLSGDFHQVNMKFFEGAKLNITENCLDRHLKLSGNKTAIIWEPNDPSQESIKLTYTELHAKVCQMSNALAKLDVKSGDRVVIYMSMIPDLLISVLACARIGATHSVVFGGFSSKALADRINDSGAKLVITNNFGPRGNKSTPLKEIVDEALTQTTTVKNVIVFQRTQDKTSMTASRDIWAHELISKQSCVHQAQSMDAEDPLFILYTSGSTGKPKGLVHTTAGYMVWTAETFKHVFQMDHNDIFWCTADIGWITGHSYIAYAPLLNGATQVMFEGIPTYPDAGRFWQTIDKHQVTHFYTAPTAIRSLEGAPLEFVTRSKLNSLKVLGSVGEPINEEAWLWYHKNIGKEKCPIVDTWWQTETGGIMISSLAGVTPSVATYATNPLPGVTPLLVDSNGKTITEKTAEGNLCIDRPWPGMARTIYGDHKRFIETYFSTFKGLYFTGDGARREDNGHYRIIGRVDDVLNVSGHRIGTAELEDAINMHADINESAVVGIPHAIKGEAVIAFATVIHPNISDAKILSEVNNIITKEIGAIAKIERIIIVAELPKTRSGKIMRRILRKITHDEMSSIGDTSTLLNPDVVQAIAAKYLEH